MILTLEEKRSIAKAVIRSHYGGLLIESKNDRFVRNDIIFNLRFYNSIKENLAPALRNHIVINEDLLGILGLAKDVLTGISVVDKFIRWFTEKFIPMLIKKISPMIPTSVKNIGRDLESYIKKFIQWIKTNVHPEGLANLFAKFKYKTLKPTSEQIQCMELASKSVYKYVMIVLVSAFILKVAGALGDVFYDALGNDELMMGSLQDLFESVGLGGIFSSLFGTYGAVEKGKKAVKLNKELKAKRDSISSNSLQNFKNDWNYCE